MKKVRRFNGEDDSYVEGTASSLADDANDQFRQDQTERMARMARGESGNAPAASASRSMAPAAAAEPEAPAAAAAAAPKAKPAIVSEKQLQAFKAEYGADKDLTDYMNKQQGLKRRNAPLPSTPSGGSGGGRGPTAQQVEDNSKKAEDYKKAEEEARSEAGKAKRAAIEKSQALEGSYPVENSAGGAAGLLKAGAGKLFGRKAVEEFVKKDPNWRNKELEILKDIPKLLGGPKKQLALPAPPSKLALPAPPKQLALPAPPRGASAAESTKAKLAGELRRGAQPTKFTSPSKSTASKKTRKFNEDEGGVEFRRGGSVSSASKRADGCAIRGKTRA